jgi:hypothetical protein
MLVRYEYGRSGIAGEAVSQLTDGAEYLVISVLAFGRGDNPKILLHVIDDDRGPGWWPSTMFVTTSSRIPPNWVARVDEEGDLHLAPEQWLRRGFWPEFYGDTGDSDSQAAARSTFVRELDVIRRASCRLPPQPA